LRPANSRRTRCVARSRESMLMYPAPVFFADSGGGAPWVGYPAPVQAFCAVSPMGFECMQPVPDHMQPAAPHRQDSHKKRVQGGRQHGFNGSMPSLLRASSGPSPTDSQASSVPTSFTSNIKKQSAHTPAAQKSRKSRKRAAIAKTAIPNSVSDAGAGTQAASDNCDELGQSFARCSEIIAQLESPGAVADSAFMNLLPATKELAFSKYGCRVIQKAIEVGSPDDLALLVEELRGHIPELYKSPHGNHVAAKFIEILRPASLGFLVAELAGTIGTVAKHQYGCRLLERLLEHCPPAQVTILVDELLTDAEPLCRHPFANFVMQHIFEHGLQPWKDNIALQIAGVLPYLSKHRTASHVVQRALEFGGEKIQRILIHALVNGEGEDSLVEVACSRYGSFVAEELAGIQVYSGPVRQLLQAGLSRITMSQYGKRAIAKFSFLPAPSAELLAHNGVEVGGHVEWPPLASSDEWPPLALL